MLTGHFGNVLGRFAARYAERFPLSAANVLSQQDNLPHVVRVVRDLAMNGLQHGMRLVANGHHASQVLRLQRRDGVEDIFPSRLPPAHELGTRGPRLQDKFLVSIAVGLFAVAGEEIQEARAHVARQMLDQNGYTVGLIIELQKKIFIVQLRESGFRQALVTAQAAQSFLDISGANLVVHTNYADAKIRHKSLALPHSTTHLPAIELRYTPPKSRRVVGTTVPRYLPGEPCMDWYFPN